MGRALVGVCVLAVGLGAGIVAAWSGGGAESAVPVPRAAAATTLARVRHAPAPPPRKRATPCPVGFEQRLGDDRLAYAAYVRTRAVAYRRPGRGRIAVFGKLNVNRYPTVFGVVGAVAGKRCRAAWYRVQLPMRPNGSVGYVRAADVGVDTVATRLEIDLSQRRLTLYRAGRAAMRTTVAIGKSATPTPIGRYYVNQLLRPDDPTGPYGPAAIGVSAFSDVLTGWAQGGPIGIHGTNEPWLLGRPVSNGCIRMTNAAITRLFPQAVPGTPVVIHP